MTVSHALIYGGAGALGRSIVGQFRKAQWTVTSIDFTPNTEATHNIVLELSTASDLDKTGRDVELKVGDVVKEQKFGAVVNAAGGWAGGALTDEGLYKNVTLMTAQSVHTSVIAARVAALYLQEGGLLTLIGASAATNGTPGMVAYGLAKAAVHQLMKSAAGTGSGLPTGVKATALLPITLDTPMNRKFMPDADYSTWTPLETVAQKIVGWATGKDVADNGGLYKVVTKSGKTDFVIV
ncbi:hypothetical protein SpCBS45565_g01005 [Spizellomyces sp. 'palustris']|nr:hypothetical protein SpCBS45565_g01005 [Spizellomyces sp. 'palustris']